MTTKCTNSPDYRDGRDAIPCRCPRCMTSPTPTRELTRERVMELRERQFKRVLNTPRPTIAELEAILQRNDVSVEIRPSGEVHAVPDSDAELIRALCDHYLAHAEREGVESHCVECGAMRRDA